MAVQLLRNPVWAFWSPDQKDGLILNPRGQDVMSEPADLWEKSHRRRWLCGAQDTEARACEGWIKYTALFHRYTHVDMADSEYFSQ